MRAAMCWDLHFLPTREGENEHHIRGSFLSQTHSGSPAPSTGRREIYQERDNTGSLSGKPWIPGQGQTGSCSCPPGIQKSWKNENRPLVIEELWDGKSLRVTKEPERKYAAHRYQWPPEVQMDTAEPRPPLLLAKAQHEWCLCHLLTCYLFIETGFHTVAQAGFILTNPPFSCVLELQVCSTMPSQMRLVNHFWGISFNWFFKYNLLNKV